VSHSINESHAGEADGDDHPTVENIQAHKHNPDFQPNLRIEGTILQFKILYEFFLIKVLEGQHLLAVMKIKAWTKIGRPRKFWSGPFGTMGPIAPNPCKTPAFTDNENDA
jgi:hypothetical protein